MSPASLVHDLETLFQGRSPIDSTTQNSVGDRLATLWLLHEQRHFVCALHVCVMTRTMQWGNKYLKVASLPSFHALLICMQSALMFLCFSDLAVTCFWASASWIRENKMARSSLLGMLLCYFLRPNFHKERKDTLSCYLNLYSEPLNLFCELKKQDRRPALFLFSESHGKNACAKQEQTFQGELFNSIAQPYHYYKARVLQLYLKKKERNLK